MKLQYSLRFFLVSASLLGPMAGYIAKYLLAEPSIEIKSVVRGRLLTGPPRSNELSLLEVSRAVRADRRKGDVHFTGKIVNVMSKHVETSTKPPRFVPLLGDAREHESRFRCIAEVEQPDGLTSKEIFFVTKHQYEMLGNVKPYKAPVIVRPSSAR